MSNFSRLQPGDSEASSYDKLNLIFTKIYGIININYSKGAKLCWNLYWATVP